ncbi:hypothetical protein [Butyrivibrio sp.]|uniref:hypothetical protein n=1 Tax=Butyrivibrio sp. TaxID=28121 RepID=UPI0025C4AFA2|nr:hypothetical protein [Butyrivibrio sp.]MBQ7428398.1 hypothetical protein [Butyrivibrio sp.]MBQ9303329.1 hypothetical protein [Butyrivibrio sp.]
MKLETEEERKYLLITERDEGLSDVELARSVNEDENTYWFSLSYNNARQIPEIISLYTDEGKIYKDDFAIYLNYKTGKIEYCEQITSDADYVDAPNPVLSLPLLKALTDKARKMVNLERKCKAYTQYMVGKHSTE